MVKYGDLLQIWKPRTKRRDQMRDNTKGLTKYIISICGKQVKNGKGFIKRKSTLVEAFVIIAMAICKEDECL
jgi:hypothetical protein